MRPFFLPFSGIARTCWRLSLTQRAFSNSPCSPDDGVRLAADVAIVGGGLGGLVAARALQLRGIAVAVYERETSALARTQGGTLDLHADSGQWAMREAGLEAETRRLLRAEGQDMRIMNMKGELLWDEITPDGVMDRPEIDRPALRQLLLDSLRPGTVRWGRELVSAEPGGLRGSEQARCRLRFADGSGAEARLLVGADGARSRVRPLLTPAEPAYCGVSFVELHVPHSHAEHARLARTVGRGSLFALGEEKGVFAQRNGDGSIRIYAGLKVSEANFQARGMMLKDAVAAKSALLAQFEGWAEDILDLIHAAAADTIVPRTVTAMPIGTRWRTRPGVTLLGDAAHVMSPFAGEGANVAMRDGAELAAALARNPDWPAAVAAYERRMFSRADRAMRDSRDGLEMCLGRGAAERLARQMWLFSILSRLLGCFARLAAWASWLWHFVCRRGQ